MPPAVSPSPVTFDAVNKVLTKILADWKVGNGNVAADLAKHGPNFLIDTAEHLKAAVAKGERLIQPNLIGQKGQGKLANLVIDLTTGLTTNTKKYPRMPIGGLNSTNGKFLDPAGPEIQTIVDWIEGGCLP